MIKWNPWANKERNIGLNEMIDKARSVLPKITTYTEEIRDKEQKEVANKTKKLLESYIEAGFTRGEAFELLKIRLSEPPKIIYEEGLKYD